MQSEVACVLSAISSAAWEGCCVKLRRRSASEPAVALFCDFYVGLGAMHTGCSFKSCISIQCVLYSRSGRLCVFKEDAS